MLSSTKFFYKNIILFNIIINKNTSLYFIKNNKIISISYAHG